MTQVRVDLIYNRDAWLFRANGRHEKVQPENGTDFQLQEIYRLIGCKLIEIVNVPGSDYVLVVDEEGKLEGKPANRVATAFALIPGDVIVGDVLLCPLEMVEITT